MTQKELIDNLLYYHDWEFEPDEKFYETLECAIYAVSLPELSDEAVVKHGVIFDDEFIRFEDGTFIDLRDPTLSGNWAFRPGKNGDKIKVIMVKEND